MKKRIKRNGTSKTVVQQGAVSSLENGIFQKFTIKEIVFLAILSAVLILTCSVMAVVAEATKVIWAVGQASTALQMSLFLTIGLMRVRKTFTTTFILVFMGAIMILMSPVMALSNLFVLITIEILIWVIFKGYKQDKACMFGGFIAPILSIVTPAIYNSILVPEVFQATINKPIMVIGMTLLVIFLSFTGSVIGLKIGKELQKSGVMKHG